jgi:ribosomal protein S12 methylthiotransferase accessory factor
MMEAIERYSAEVLCQKLVTGTYDEVNRHAETLDPILVQRYFTVPYDKGMVFDWVYGTDLLSGSSLLVPAQLAGFPWFGHGCRISLQSTNGLASGNIMDEAIAHALAEVIERDALTLAVVKTQIVPGIQQWIHSTFRSCQEKIPVDNIPSSFSPPDDIQTDILQPPLETLVNLVSRTGARFWLKDITSDLNIPSFAAGILQEIQPGKNFVGVGFGTHPDRTIAAARAITEAVLGRAVQVQGAREHMMKTYEDDSHGDSPGMWWKDSNHAKPLSCLQSFEHDDILDDNLLMLDRLKRRGVSHVIAVDLTHERLGIPVVRLIVPELEFWSAFDFDPKCCTLGEKALGCLQ